MLIWQFLHFINLNFLYLLKPLWNTFYFFHQIWMFVLGHKYQIFYSIKTLLKIVDQTINFNLTFHWELSDSWVHNINWLLFCRFQSRTFFHFIRKVWLHWHDGAPEIINTCYYCCTNCFFWFTEIFYYYKKRRRWSFDLRFVYR